MKARFVQITLLLLLLGIWMEGFWGVRLRLELRPAYSDEQNYDSDCCSGQPEGQASRTYAQYGLPLASMMGTSLPFSLHLGIESDSSSSEAQEFYLIFQGDLGLAYEPQLSIRVPMKCQGTA